MTTALLQEDPEIPGLVFSESSTEVTITPSDKQTNHQDGNGISLFIPGNSCDQVQKIKLATSVSGAYEMPYDLESVSSAYIIQTTDVIEFSKDVDVSLQHAAYLATVMIWWFCRLPSAPMHFKNL